MDEPRVVRITIEYEDGKVKQAKGPAADAIMRWWINCEVMQALHGHQYDGPTLEETKPASKARVRATKKEDKKR